MAELPGTPMPTSGWCAVGPCPACGSERMRAVSDGYGTNFLCESCGACWFDSKGWLGRVDPFTCQGCTEQQLEVCRARKLAREEHASRDASAGPPSPDADPAAERQQPDHPRAQLLERRCARATPPHPAAPSGPGRPGRMIVS